MQSLSIRQPWAWLIVHGIKNVENRTWKTNYRGPFLVHAGKQFDDAGYHWVMSNVGLALPARCQFKLGGIVGKADLIDCVTEHDSAWFTGPYGFVLDPGRAMAIPFIPMRGRLGFFDVEDFDAQRQR